MWGFRAGHCINAGSCGDTAVVFDATNETMLPDTTIPANTLYTCAEVLASHSSNGLDWAVFRLNAAVPTSVATPALVGTGEMATGTGLMMIGHPSSLPRKYADEATITQVVAGGTGALRYSTDLDSFAGNSGSGAFALEILNLSADPFRARGERGGGGGGLWAWCLRVLPGACMPLLPARGNYSGTWNE